MDKAFWNVQVAEVGALSGYRFVVIFARYQGKWLYARKKGFSTWETAGGHIEPGESPEQAACRELWEETGAAEYTIRPICDYSAEWQGDAGSGRVFLAEVTRLGKLPEDFEMAEVQGFDRYPEEMTYPDILPILWERLTDTPDL